MIHSQSDDHTLCLIDCEGTARAEHRGFHFVAAVSTGNVTLQGIGVINGYVTDGGGGIWVEGADPTSHCAVEGCTVDDQYGKGGGLRVSHGSGALVMNSRFSENTSGYGGGVSIDGAAGFLMGCEVSDNVATDVAGGVYVDGSGVMQVSNCDIIRNQAPKAGGVRLSGARRGSWLLRERQHGDSGHSGGVWLQGGFVNGCTIVKNSAAWGGGGVHCEAGTGSINHCLIAFSENGYGVAAEAGNVPALNCCDVYGNARGDYDSVVGDQTGFSYNISQDPELCGLEHGDYRLHYTSPCTDVNSPCRIQVGCYDRGCDTPVREMSWGRVKAL